MSITFFFSFLLWDEEILRVGNLSRTLLKFGMV